MKIGILGGTFDPIHFGHIQLGMYAHQHMGLDEIWFMPNRYPPHKKMSELKDSHIHRGEMIKLVIADIPYFKLCDYELIIDEVSYTYHTMEALKQQYPKDELFFIIGSDSLFTFETWNEPQRILNTCSLLVAARTVDDLSSIESFATKLMDKYLGEIKTVIMPVFPVSSTEVRELLFYNNDTSRALDIRVIDYIRKHNIYIK